MSTVPAYEFMGVPVELKQGDAKNVDDDLQVEDPPGSGTWVAYDLTNRKVWCIAKGVTAFLANPTGTPALSLEAALRDPDATKGKVRMALTATQTAGLVPEDHVAEWEIRAIDGTTIIETIPAGRTYRRWIVGRGLG